MAQMFFKSQIVWVGMIMHVCDPSIQEDQAGGSKVQSFLGLHSENLSRKQNKTKQSNKNNLIN